MSAATALVYATLLEARPLLARLEARQVEAAPCAMYAGAGTRILICGMGLDAARAGMRHLIERHAPRRIVNCGVAGSLSAGVEVGEIVQIAATTLDEPGTGPAVARYRRIAGVALPAAAGIRAGARLLSRAEPLFDAALRAQLGAVADLVDMEGAIVAEACAASGIDCALFKAVSDDARDRATLLGNLDRTSALLAAFVHEHLNLILHGKPGHDVQRPLLI